MDLTDRENRRRKLDARCGGLEAKPLPIEVVAVEHREFDHDPAAVRLDGVWERLLRRQNVLRHGLQSGGRDHEREDSFD